MRLRILQKRLLVIQGFLDRADIGGTGHPRHRHQHAKPSPFKKNGGLGPLSAKG